MNVVGTVVDTKSALIGLIFSGKESEFGGVSSQNVERRVPLQNIPDGLETAEIKIVNRKIELKNGFALSHLQRMEVLAGDKCYPVDNSISLVNTIKNGNNTLGFDVKFGEGTVKRLTTQAISNLSTYFHPTNFVVREINGKPAICGKPGTIKIEQLPVIDIGIRNEKKSKVSDNKVKKSIKPLEEYDEVKGFDVDIFDIYDYIRTNGGYIVKLPDEKYKSTQGGNTIDYNWFKVDCDVEVAAATPKYGEKKINATLSFRKYGVVTSEETGKQYGTFTFTSKCIFSNGENLMKKIGVLIDAHKTGFFRNKLFNAHEVNDAKVMETLGHLVDIKGKVLLSIDLTEVGLLSDNKRKQSILSNEQIKDICIKSYGLKLMSKYLSNSGELIKGLKKRLGTMQYAELMNGGIYSGFRGKSKEELMDMKSAGINIIGGDYRRYMTASDSADADKKDKENDIYIEYIYAGLDYTKVTGKQLVEMAMTGDTSKVPMGMIKVVNAIEHIKDDKEKVAHAKKIQEQIDAEMAEMNRTMWEHRAAMFLEGRKKYIHTHDKASWIPDEKSKAKKFSVYINKDFADLQIRFSGVEI